MANRRICELTPLNVVKKKEPESETVLFVSLLRTVERALLKVWTKSAKVALKPEPALEMVNPVIAPLVSMAVAVAPVPPPPVIEMVGAEE